MTTILTLSKDDFEFVEPNEELYLQQMQVDLQRL